MTRRTRATLVVAIVLPATVSGCRRKWTNVSCVQLRRDIEEWRRVHADERPNPTWQAGPRVCVDDALLLGPESHSICSRAIEVGERGLWQALGDLSDQHAALGQEKGFTREELRRAIGAPVWEFRARVCGELEHLNYVDTFDGFVEVRGPVRFLTPQRRKFQATIHQVFGLLAAEDFDAVERLASGGLAANDLRSIFARWGRHLQLPSDDDLTYHAGREPERSVDPVRWHRTYRLSTVEDGTTDSTISITIIDLDGPTGLYDLQIESVDIV